jgi:hypothetical protein
MPNSEQLLYRDYVLTHYHRFALTQDARPVGDVWTLHCSWRANAHPGYHACVLLHSLTKQTLTIFSMFALENWKMPNNLSEAHRPADTHPPETLKLWTVGHSTRPLEEFLGLLQAYDIQLLADVRITPYSRRNPQFHSDALAKSLSDAGIQYRHLPALGGRRKSRPDSVNAGWRNESFRGYADYMQTREFWKALDDLVATGQRLPVAIMCAEAVPWRCHRSLISDALVGRGWVVQHILSAGSLQTHALTSFAKLEAGRLTYPGEPESDLPLPLFE